MEILWSALLEGRTVSVHGLCGIGECTVPGVRSLLNEWYYLQVRKIHSLSPDLHSHSSTLVVFGTAVGSRLPLCDDHESDFVNPTFRLPALSAPRYG